MNLLKRLVLISYVFMVMFLACFIILFVTHALELQHVANALFPLYNDETLRWIAGGLAAILLIMNFAFYRYFAFNVPRGKIIAFDNPAGRVTVSLGAIEELIKRMVVRMPEIREARTTITASRKGLKIRMRLIIFSEVNIPDLTLKIQELVTAKIQETIGIDEPIIVTIYIAKIVAPIAVKEKRPKSDAKPEEKPEVNIPFRGYRA